VPCGSAASLTDGSLGKQTLDISGRCQIRFGTIALDHCTDAIGFD
jgi:hypothetical protein